MKYVAGFAIATNCKSVLLVEKTHPTWQRGRLNGIGGRVQSGESLEAAQAREFREETKGQLVGSALYLPSGWRHYVSFLGSEWECAFFVGFLNADDMFKLHNDVNDEGERLVHCEMVDVHCANVNMLPTITWLIPLAVQLDACHDNCLPFIVHEKSPGAMSRAQDRRRGDRAQR